jgi:transcriptional regulator with XRE-family HTH domain
MNITTQQIAEKIRQLRESKYYSQEYMGVKMGIGQNAYSKIELNRTRMKVEHLLSIAKLLEVDAAQLLMAAS